MKSKIPEILSVALALVLVLSFSLVMAVPVSATHTPAATIGFQTGASDRVGEASVLDVTVTNEVGSLGTINEVKIDFSESDFAVTGPGAEVTDWTGSLVGDVVTYTPTVGIAPDSSVIFSPAVTNPDTAGPADNPTVLTSDLGTKATLTTGESGTNEISYEADEIGTIGNNISVEYAAGDTFAVAVVGTAITVTLGTEDPTADEVVAAIEEHGDASAFVDATTVDTGVVAVMGVTPLDGGSSPDVDTETVLTEVLDIKEFAVTADPAVNTSGTLTDYTITFTTLEVIEATAGTITITFPAGYDIFAVSGEDVTMETGDPLTLYTPSAIAVEGQVVTITATLGIGIAADVPVVITIANVGNPPASGDYDITVAGTAPDTDTATVTIIPASFKVVAGADNTVTAGTAFAVTVTAQNADSGTDTGYAGDHFIDFDWVGVPTGAPIIPAFELIPFIAGEGTSPANFILTVAGEDDVTIKATDEDDVTGTSAAITIKPTEALDHFTISGEPTGVVAGEGFASPAEDITVTAYDAKGNVKTDYAGTVTWSSTDGLAVLPAAYTFTSEDAGVHVFLGSEFTLKTSGRQTITVTDATAEVSKESATIEVTPAAAASIVVSASPDVIEADGSDISTITATALDEFGNVDTNYVEDKSITIASSLGTIADANPSFTLGEASTTLTSDDKVGTATIRVTSDFDLATTTVKLLADIGITTITVTVDKITILNNGEDVCTITATYTDGSNIVTAAHGADYKVTFSTTPEEGVTLSATEVNPVDGVAEVTLTTEAAPETSITVTADGIGTTTGDSSITVTAPVSYSAPLSPGWNLLSTPILLAAESDTLEQILGTDEEKIEGSYRWDVISQQWEVPTGYELSPLEAVYLKVYAGASAAAKFVPSGEVSGPPSRELQPGLNLIGPAPVLNGTFPDTLLEKALVTIEVVPGDLLGYTMVVCPAHNQVGWTYTIHSTPGETYLVPYQGYWVVMENGPDTLVGFSTTPIQ